MLRPTPEIVGVEAGFSENSPERIFVFQVEFTPEKALEYSRRVFAEAPVALSVEPAYQGEAGVKDLLWPADDEPALVGEAPRVGIEIAHLEPVALRPLLKVAAIG